MLRRKALLNSRDLDFMDTTTKNVDKTLAILHMMEGPVLKELSVCDTATDFKNAMWAVKDFLFEIKEAGEASSKETTMFADTLEEYQASVEAEQNKIETV